MRRANVVLVVILLGLVGLFAYQYFAMQRGSDGVGALETKYKVGQTAPDIEGEDIEGVKFKLSDYRGKVVVLDFWGFW